MLEIRGDFSAALGTPALHNAGIVVVHQLALGLTVLARA